LPTQACDLLLQVRCFGFGDIAVLSIRMVERRQITRDAGLHLLDPYGDRGHSEILVTVVDGFELTLSISVEI